jgi:protein gp37
MGSETGIEWTDSTWTPIRARELNKWEAAFWQKFDAINLERIAA